MSKSLKWHVRPLALCRRWRQNNDIVTLVTKTVSTFVTRYRGPFRRHHIYDTQSSPQGRTSWRHSLRVNSHRACAEMSLSDSIPCFKHRDFTNRRAVKNHSWGRKTKTLTAKWQSRQSLETKLLNEGQREGREGGGGRERREEKEYREGEEREKGRERGEGRERERVGKADKEG